MGLLCSVYTVHQNKFVCVGRKSLNLVYHLKTELMNTTTPPRILYVDDDTDDCFFLSTSLQESSSGTELVCAGNGEEAIQYLHSVPPSGLPALIVLDLNMPRLDGRQVLSYLKEQPHLSGIPVVMLSTSDNKVYKDECTRLGAARFLKKPFHFDGYRDIVDNFIDLIRD